VTIIGLFALVPSLILLVFGAKRLVDRIRRSIIWKDSGFVKSLKWQVNWQITLLAVVVSVAMIILSYWMMIRGSISRDVVLRSLVSAIGVATGIVYFGMGIALGLQRYKWVGMAGGVFSALILIIQASFSASWLLVGILWMVILSLSGTWALRQSLLALKGGNSD
jgi:hypothetical protein